MITMRKHYMVLAYMYISQEPVYVYNMYRICIGLTIAKYF